MNQNSITMDLSRINSFLNQQNQTALFLVFAGWLAFWIFPLRWRSFIVYVIIALAFLVCNLESWLSNFITPVTVKCIQRVALGWIAAWIMSLIGKIPFIYPVVIVTVIVLFVAWYFGNFIVITIMDIGERVKNTIVQYRTLCLKCLFGICTIFLMFFASGIVQAACVTLFLMWIYNNFNEIISRVLNTITSMFLDMIRSMVLERIQSTILNPDSLRIGIFFLIGILIVYILWGTIRLLIGKSFFFYIVLVAVVILIVKEIWDYIAN